VNADKILTFTILSVKANPLKFSPPGTTRFSVFHRNHQMKKLIVASLVSLFAVGVFAEGASAPQAAASAAAKKVHKAAAKKAAKAAAAASAAASK
jgi:hypothetical protein